MTPGIVTPGLLTLGDAAFLAALPEWAFAFVLVLARIGCAVMLMPGLGEAEMPAMVRAGLVLAITLLLLPGVHALMPTPPDGFAPIAGMVAAEVAAGLWFGWLARLIVQALPVAGQFISYLLGLSNVLQQDAEFGSQATALGRLLSLAAPVVVLASGLYVPVLAALDGSYQLIAPGTLLPVGDAAQTGIGAVAASFALALQLAAPFVLASVVWQVATGLMARLVPRLQIYFVAMPAQILGGLALLSVLIPVLLSTWQEAVRSAYALLPGVL